MNPPRENVTSKAAASRILHPMEATDPDLLAICLLYRGDWAGDRFRKGTTTRTWVKWKDASMEATE